MVATTETMIRKDGLSEIQPEPPTFVSDDFAVFEAPDFKVRMPLLRARIKPKLIILGEHLRGDLSAVLKEPLYTHVAQHLRRTVNPPEATWVAFARAVRAYKPYVHIRVAVNLNSVRVSVFVEDYAEDKLLFADNLAQNADLIAAYMRLHPKITAYDIPNSEGRASQGAEVSADVLRSFADRMHRIKGQHAVFGIDLPKKQLYKKSGDAFLKSIRGAVKSLKPIYDLGKRSR